MSTRHFIDIDQLDHADLRNIIDSAKKMKQEGRNFPRPDERRVHDTLIMIFEKASTRTRVSFDVAMRQLGGQTIVLNSNEMQLGRGEPVSDTAQVLSRYAELIMMRTTSHDSILELAKYATIPVVNGLSNLSHPCQIMADILTFEEKKFEIEKAKIAWIGDVNNVARSWIHAAARFGFDLRLGCPREYGPSNELANWIEREKANVVWIEDPHQAVGDVDCVVTDVFVSMGDSDAERRNKVLADYIVDSELMAKADSDAIFMHCLPAQRGSEVAAEIIDGPQSVVFDEAENRLHAQKSILAWCLKMI